jgi:hypothetical protein
MTNTNTNNDILEIFENENNSKLNTQIDIFANISLENENVEINDIFADLNKEIKERQVSEEALQKVEIKQDDVLQELE